MIKINKDVEAKILSYPAEVSDKLMQIRQLINIVAKENNITDLQETFKWGQPSYICKTGSTLRIDYAINSNKPIAIYLNCKTRLGEVIKEVYGDFFIYESNRTILFSSKEALPAAEIKQIIKMVLKYHELKHLPLLGT